MKSTEGLDQKVGNVPTRLSVFLVLTVVAYFLSVGPVLSVAARVHCYGTPAYRFLRALYSPVFALAKSSDTGTSVYESYTRMWCRIVLPPGSPGT